MSIDSNPLSGTLFEESAREKRLGYLRQISSAGRWIVGPRHRRRSPFEAAVAEGHSYERADKAFFDAAAQVVRNEREQIAASLDQAGKHREAELVRGRAAPPEWSKP